MTDFESLKELFQFLKLSNAPKKHWKNPSGWGMVRTMHDAILKQIENGFATKHIFSIDCDEITTLDNQSWISTHAYVVEN